MEPHPKNDTCVYIHTRSDDVVFYVGIGRAKRPYESTKRNTQWLRTTRKYAWTVTILHKNLSWEQACAIEIELIAKYRLLSGDRLCNATNGGDGAKGVKLSESRIAAISALHKGKKVSEATLEKLRLAATNPSPETRAKMSASAKGKVLSVETRAKISAAMKNPSPETRAKMSEALKGNTRSVGNTNWLGKKLSEEHKCKLLSSNLGNTYRLGKKLSPESIAKRTATRKANREIKEQNEQ